MTEMPDANCRCNQLTSQW